MTRPIKGSYLLREGRVSIGGNVYFITKSTLARLQENQDYRQGLLMGEGIPEIIESSLQWLENDKFIQNIAYVIMPDHIHLLFKLGENNTLPHTMLRFGRHTGRQIAKKLGRQGAVWQESYFDRAVRNDEELKKAFDYIMNNPIKAGYVEDASDWKWLYPQQEEEIDF
jgi:putative transposase